MIEAGQTVYFGATVRGTGNFSDSVSWSVNGVKGGDSTNGTITPLGAYKAPAGLPSPNPVTISATSMADLTKSGSVSLPVYTLTITPSPATVFYNHTQQFTATITGITNPTVTWTASYGSITNTGFFTAPTNVLGQNFQDSVYVHVAGGGDSVSDNVTLAIPPPVINSVAPSSASANETITITGQDLYGLASISFPGPFGSTLSPPFSPTLTGFTTTVPLGAVTGTVNVRFTPADGVTNSGSFAFTRMPNLRIRANQKDITGGESVQFAYRLLGATSPNTINWTTDLGTVSNSGLYQAPVVTQESFATVTACLVGTNSCDATMLRILPMRISPAMPDVALGKAVQLDAIEGSLVSANWSVLAGGGSINGSGRFTAPTTVAQAGAVPVSATANSTTQTGSVAVTGAFPGVVSRTYDYLNEQNQSLEGTYVSSLAVIGTRAYIMDHGVRWNPTFGTSPSFAALEVYDISDPANPVWLDATEAVSSFPQLLEAVNGFPILLSSYGHYVFEVDITAIGTHPSRIALYDVQSTPPVLVSYVQPPDLGWAWENDGVIYAVPADIPVSSVAPIYVFDIRSGTVSQTEIDLPLPSGVTGGNVVVEAIGTGNRMYLRGR